MTAEPADVQSTPAPNRAQVAWRARLSKIITIALILSVAAVARFYSIGHESYWIDELYTLETSAGNGLAHENLPIGRWLAMPPPMSTTDVARGGGIDGIILHAPQDTQAPLYFAALNVWRHAFGSSESAVRALSGLCSLAAVAALGALLHTLSGPRAALLAMSIAALSGTQIVFAQEARPYAMALLWLVLAAVALVAIERRGFSWTRGIWLGAALLALLLTHYAGFAPALALLVYSLTRLRARARTRSFLVFATAACAFAALWGRTVLAQRHEALDRLVFLRDDPAGHRLRTLDRALCQPLSMLLAAPNISAQPQAWRFIARAIGIVLLAAPAVLLIARRHPVILLPWLLLIFPIAQTALADLYMTRAALELPRFSFLGSAGAVATTACLIGWVQPIWLARVTSALVLSILMSLLVCPSALDRPNAYARGKPEFRRLASELRADVQQGDALVVAVPTDEPWQAGTLLTGLAHYTGAWPGPVVLLQLPGDAALLGRLRTAPRVWMLSPTPDLPNERLLPGSKIERGSTKSVRNVGTVAWLILPASRIN